MIRQYKDKRYPWNCDFYIPSEDLFIECNFHWTHGGHEFFEKKDREKLNFWQSKNNIYYKNAIKTWTIRDKEKLEKARSEKLNFLVFYSENEFNKWFEEDRV